MLDTFATWEGRAYALILCLCPFVLSYFLTSVLSASSIRSNHDNKSPPIDPSADFIFGNLFAFAFDTRRYFAHLITRYGNNTPVRIRVANQQYFFISGAQSILRFFRTSRELSTTPATVAILENVFGSPPETASILINDNTGFSVQPLEGSNPIPQDQRYHHIIHNTIHTNLMGVGLADLASRYLENLEKELDALSGESEEWIEIPDLYTLVQNTIFKASTMAICGPHLFELNPTFTDDFWEFDIKVGGLIKGLPRFLVPSSYRVRDRLIDEIMKWHEFAESHIDRKDVELEKKLWEPYYGSKLVRDRARELSQIKGYNDKARAANDLGLIWGANANIVPIVGWFLLDTISRPEVLSRVRNELSNIAKLHPSSSTSEHMPELMSNPLLQSIYCEELRLRSGTTIQRSPISSNYKLGPWKFPKDDMIIASVWFEGRDKTVWNEGPNGEHDVEDFWPDRFIVYPNDPNSGPRRPESASAKSKSDKVKEPTFTVDSVNGAFIPYGGGQKMCPGRFYAKQEALGALAMFLNKFDIELMEEKQIVPDLSYFPMGILPPKGKYPARLRRRKEAV
ncbi:hypothetical protein CJF32_00006861 [Rutstroemia sp. NJR-2017a WRK4]|nr:hypothetical protein CJF32_00006861 [Rutstroemia sp. NJR-2017a WRK4]